MSKRLLLETDKRLLWKIAYLLGFKGALSVEKFKRRRKKGVVFPPFLYISIVNSCNLSCQGCWVDVKAKREALPIDEINRMIREAQKMGNTFFGILGGEPFLHPDIFRIFEENPKCYFQVFTNGHFITEDIAKRLAKCGNVSPLISVEGSEIISDTRRGGKNVYSKSIDGIKNCIQQKLITGVCTSLCQTNIEDLLQERWVDALINMGALYMWYHTYRPVGPDAKPELALTPEQQMMVRRFVVEMRAKKPIGIIDAYYDGDGKALCPAVTGISHHINPWGDVEPCPIIQLSTKSIKDKDGTIVDKLVHSEYLKDFREQVAKHTRGCVVLERPDLLKELSLKHGAKDTTARQKTYEELSQMVSRPSQSSGQEAIPEKSFVYRLAKKLWYQDFGVYRI